MVVCAWECASTRNQSWPHDSAIVLDLDPVACHSHVLVTTRSAYLSVSATLVVYILWLLFVPIQSLYHTFFQYWHILHLLSHLLSPNVIRYT